MAEFTIESCDFPPFPGLVIVAAWFVWETDGPYSPLGNVLSIFCTSPMGSLVSMNLYQVAHAQLK